MNRRGFIAGLLASSAAVPIAKLAPFETEGLELVETGGFDIFAKPAYAWHRHSVGFKVNELLIAAAEAHMPSRQDFTRWGPDPGTVWFDEAATIEQWQVDLILELKRSVAILDAAPVPSENRYRLDALGDGMLSLDQAQEANHDRLDDRPLGSNPVPAGDRRAGADTD